MTARFGWMPDDIEIVKRGPPPPPNKRWPGVKAQSLALLKFDPNQPRDPAGTDTGGQWTSTGGAASKPEAAAATGEAKKGKAEFLDFDKSRIQLDEQTTIDPKKKEKFVQRWNERVKEAPDAFREEFLGGLKGTMGIYYNDSDDTLRINGELHDDTGKGIGTYTRVLDLDDNYANSEYFKIYKKEDQGKGIAKQMLAGNVAVYQKLGFDKVKVNAGLDVGGHAWAKYGYVPEPNSWTNLRRDIARRLDRSSGRSSGGSGNTYEPGSWEELTHEQQEDIQNAWRRDTEQEFLESEISSWRESGEALSIAKHDLAEEFTREAEWAQAGMERWRERNDDAEKPKVPFTDQQILNAITIDYDRERDYEGRADPEISFDDSVLDSMHPEGFDPRQGTLPGIEPVAAHELLTEDMRDEIESELIRSFNLKAEDEAGDVEPPEYLRDNTGEYQDQYWDDWDDDARYRWAQLNGELPQIEIEDDDDDEEVEVEVDEGPAAALRKLVNSSNPKALWAIADFAQGKELLLGSGWSGVLNLRDKDTMDRFNAYVGKRKK